MKKIKKNKSKSGKPLKQNCCKIEAVIQRCSVKKVFLKILQNLQENPVPESIF